MRELELRLAPIAANRCSEGNAAVRDDAGSGVTAIQISRPSVHRDGEDRTIVRVGYAARIDEAGHEAALGHLVADEHGS